MGDKGKAQIQALIGQREEFQLQWLQHGEVSGSPRHETDLLRAQFKSQKNIITAEKKEKEEEKEAEADNSMLAFIIICMYIYIYRLILRDDQLV